MRITTDKPLVDVILSDYYPYKWAANLLKLNPTERVGSDSDESNDGKSESNVEKWILVAFCSICILAMVVCIIVLIVYKVRKNRRQR